MSVRTPKLIAQQAMDIQYACNLRGLSDSLPELIDELRAHGVEVRTSPVVYLWLSKMLSLASGGECLCEGSTSRYGSAYRACERIVETGLWSNPDRAPANQTCGV